jgi:hypothetical protein
MTDWTSTDLATIGDTKEVEIAPDRADGSQGPYTTIWVVRVGDELYVRSYLGTSGAWYRRAVRNRRGRIRAGALEREVSFTDVEQAVESAIDEAYRSKYGRSSSSVAAMVAPEAAATSLRLLPG